MSTDIGDGRTRDAGNFQMNASSLLSTDPRHFSPLKSRMSHDGAAQLAQAGLEGALIACFDAL